MPLEPPMAQMVIRRSTAAIGEPLEIMVSRLGTLGAARISDEIRDAQP
jgi:hypothetical protein